VINIARFVKINECRWSNWRLILQLDFWNVLNNGSLRPFYNHGSPDSLDVDRDYLFYEMPDVADAHLFSQGVDEDRNIIVVKEGSIIDALKGVNDECNNALFTTYSFHQQQFPCPVLKKSNRVVIVKLLSTIRKVVSAIADYPPERDIVLKLIRSIYFLPRLEYFKQLDMTICGQTMGVEPLKSIAFQYAQTLSLVRGEEIYTKQEASKAYPELSCFLYRRETEMKENLIVLNNIKNQLLEEMEDIEFFQTEDICLSYADPKKVKKWNILKVQLLSSYLCRDKIIGYGFDHEIDIKTSWYDPEEPKFTYNSEKEYIIVTEKNERLKGGKYDIETLFFPLISSEAIFCHQWQEKSDLIKTLFNRDYNNNEMEFEKYIYIFELINNDSLQLISLRSKYSYRLIISQEQIQTIEKKIHKNN